MSSKTLIIVFSWRRDERYLRDIEILSRIQTDNALAKKRKRPKEKIKIQNNTKTKVWGTQTLPQPEKISGAIKKIGFC